MVAKGIDVEQLMELFARVDRIDSAGDNQFRAGYLAGEIMKWAKYAIEASDPIKREKARGFVKANVVGYFATEDAIKREKEGYRDTVMEMIEGNSAERLKEIVDYYEKEYGTVKNQVKISEKWRGKTVFSDGDVAQLFSEIGTEIARNNYVRHLIGNNRTGGVSGGGRPTFKPHADVMEPTF